MTLVGVAEDLEVAVLEVAQVMEEAMVAEDLDLATRVGAPGVVWHLWRRKVWKWKWQWFSEIVTKLSEKWKLW